MEFNFLFYSFLRKYLKKLAWKFTSSKTTCRSLEASRNAELVLLWSGDFYVTAWLLMVNLVLLLSGDFYVTRWHQLDCWWLILFFSYQFTYNDILHSSSWLLMLKLVLLQMTFVKLCILTVAGKSCFTMVSFSFCWL